MYNILYQIWWSQSIVESKIDLTRFFPVAVDNLTSTSIKKMNALATKCIKNWLELTRSTTVAVLHLPDILDLLHLTFG